MKIYKRYVDDINILLRYIGHGYRYNETEIVRDPESEEEDRNRNKDEVMMELMKEIGDSIHPSIQLTTDYPSKNQDEKIPILNLKVWMERNQEEQTNILYEHYRKEVSKKSTVHARSAMGIRQKRSILSQDLLTIMNNCSPLLGETRRKEHVNEYMKRLQFSGYDKEFRFDVYNAARNARQKIVQESTNVTRPLHQPKEWRRIERKAEKKGKMKTW